MASAALEPARARSRRAITVTAFAFLVTMMGTTIPTPLYSIYSAELSFSPLTVTVLFAVYAIGVVGALSLFGRLSDDLGRRPVLMLAVGLALLSAILFLLPPSLMLLIVARVVSGLGAGFMSGAGTAAVIDLFAPEKRATAATLAVAANTGGLALGTLIAGILASAAPLPLTIPFAAHLALCVMAFLGLALWAPAPTGRVRLRIRPHRLRVPASIRGAFARAVLAAGTGFAITGVLTAVTAMFLSRDLHLDSHALAGFVVFLAFAGMATGQLIARGMRPRIALPVGCAGLIVASVALAVALAGSALAPLIVAAAVLGVSGGLCLNAGIATTVEQVPPAVRGEVSSSFFAGIYLMLAVPAIGVGLLASVIGLRQAGLVFTAAVALLAAVVGIVELASARKSASR
ncbi:MFS transporter [Agromyces sp. Root81]|uniref:MFS transporter n=1 Tax=Agromyces sp. Root81 TaxID=1736601 RepID=UPI0007014665|nr:MFS transporter [Agromyces sp. Root81]KRC58587.1 MFS transporter [Agromyces sp. Root81]